jgi:glycine betaine/choline ABC-type transport system substrate-binding protein
MGDVMFESIRTVLDSCVGTRNAVHNNKLQKTVDLYLEKTGCVLIDNQWTKNNKAVSIKKKIAEVNDAIDIIYKRTDTGILTKLKKANDY